jgi:SAM-dependent methyltransferase
VARVHRRRDDRTDRAALGSLDHYTDPELYDHEYRQRRSDVRFYQAVARRLLGGPGKILELGCGSGRVTLPLLRDGHQVVGLDHSPQMLERLGERLERSPAKLRQRCRLVAGDLRDFTVGGRYPLVIAAFNVIEHLYTRSELAACLGRVSAHLAPGGRFVFDVQVPDLEWLTRDQSQRHSITRYKHPRTGQWLVYSTNHFYDPIAQIALIRLYYAPVGARGEERVVHLWQRKFYPAELEALVAASGFVVEDRYGDFTGAPLVGGAETQILVCRKIPRKSK